MGQTTIEVIGFAAATLTTLAPGFQLVKTIRSGKTDDLSLWMWLASLAGVILWFFYGIYTHSRPIVIANTIAFAVVVIMLGYMMRNRYKKKNTSP